MGSWKGREGRWGSETPEGLMVWTGPVHARNAMRSPCPCSAQPAQVLALCVSIAGLFVVINLAAQGWVRERVKGLAGGLRMALCMQHKPACMALPSRVPMTTHVHPHAPAALPHQA